MRILSDKIVLSFVIIVSMLVVWRDLLEFIQSRNFCISCPPLTLELNGMLQLPGFNFSVF